MAIPFEARLPGTPLGVRMLRREMAGIAADCGMDAEGVADVKLAVTEAATNAVMRAYSETGREASGFTRSSTVWWSPRPHATSSRWHGSFLAPRRELTPA
jgi:hypothetical protein